MNKKILMVAGPNGAGKTTTAKSFFSTEIFEEFINADEIARGLAPFNPETVSLAASKLMLKRFRELIESKTSFAFETTGAATNYIKHLKEAKKVGYEVDLMFLWLPNPDIAVERVANRVKQGGHHIPEDTIRRRYFAGLRNLVKFYLPLVDTALILNNSIAGTHKIVACKDINYGLKIEDPDIWQQIKRIAYAQEK